MAIMEEVKAHGDNGWRDALDGVIVDYTGRRAGAVASGRHQRNCGCIT